MTWLTRFYPKLLILALIATPQVALAASGEAPTVLGFVAKLFNFAIVLGVLIYVLKKGMPEYLAKRSDTVAQDLKEAAEKEDKAIELLKDYEQKMTKLNDEIDSMLAEAKKKAESEHARILKQAKDEAHHIIESAKQTAIRLEERAMQDIANQITSKAFIKAQQSIARQLETGAKGSAQHTRLVKEFLGEVNQSARQ